MNCFRFLVLSAVLASLPARAEVWELPPDVWTGARIRRSDRQADVRDAKGRVFLTVSASKAHPSLDGVALAVGPDGLSIDVSAARKKGLEKLVVRVPVPAAGLAGRSLAQLADWTGEDTAEIDLYWEAQQGTRYRYDFINRVFGGRRRTFAQVMPLPADIRSLTFCYDLSKFGAKGRFTFHGTKAGPLAEMKPFVEERTVAAHRPVRTFYAPFDGTAEASDARGARRPVEARGLAYAPGVCGEAVRLSTAAKSVLAYAAASNAAARAGTVSLWVRRDNPERRLWRTMFAFPDSGKRCGNGQIWFWWWENALRFDAADDARNWSRIARTPDAAWHHVAVAWDETGYRIYLDGRCARDSKADFLADGTSPILRVLKGSALDRYSYDRVEPDRFFVGCRRGGAYALDGLVDELEVWDGPLGEAEIVALSRRHAAAAGIVQPTKPDYAKLFANDGPNSYEKPSKGVAPDLDLELLETIPLDRAGVAKLTADKRFRAVGDVSYGTLGGTTYLECGRRRNDRIAVRFKVDPKDPLYVIDVDYPDDAKRTADIIVQGTQLAKSDGQTGADYALQVGYFCGDECPNSNRILTHRCLYWTWEDDCAILLTTARTDVPAAASAIRIYRVRDAKLPSLATDEPSPTNGWGRTFALYYEDPAIGYDFATRLSSGHDCGELSTMIDRTAAYMKYCGQNLFCYPGVWYQGRIGAGRYNPRGHADDFLSAWYEKFDREGLFLVPNVNPNNMPISTDVLNVASLTDGSLHDSPIAIHRTGVPNWGGWHNTPPNFCFAHPDVQSNIAAHIDALLAQGVGHPSFKGICLHMTMHCMLWWGDIASGYNDYCIEAFERDMKVKVRKVEKVGGGGDGKDPFRGKAYYEKITGDPALYEKWVQWRCDQVTAFYARQAAKLRAARPDLKLWFNSFIQPDFRQPDFTTPGFMHRQAREAGLDGAALAKIPNAILCQTAYPSFVRKRERNLFPSDEAYAYNRVLQHRKGYNALLDGAAYPWVQLFDLYWENAAGREKNALSCDWLKECGWRVTTLNPGGVHALRDFAIPLRYRDILGFSKGGYLVGTYGMEPYLRRFAAAFRSLPPVVMSDVTGDEFVRVRACTYRGRRYAYVVNTACEPRTFGAWNLDPYELRVLGEGENLTVALPQPSVPDPKTLPQNAGRTLAFEHPFPRYYLIGAGETKKAGEKNRAVGTYNNWELSYPGLLSIAGPGLGEVMWQLRKVVWADRRLVFVDGRTLVCQLNWIRDHVHQSKAFCHWEHDQASFLDFILDTQRADGQFYELIKQWTDYHWAHVNPDCVKFYPDDAQTLVRLELEADIEYLMVEGCLQTWRATGDDDWLKRALPRLEKGIDYQTSDYKRWDAAHGLCKRPYTIDTWDFLALAGGHDRRVNLDGPMAIMHGDNTGVYQAMNQLAFVNRRFGNEAKARDWERRAAELRANVMKHLYNGRFFVHQLPLNCPPVDEHERERLTLSDAYALNRGIWTPEENRRCIEEYRARRQTVDAFAEWYTIDPPIANASHKPGEYVNGAVSPFTAGELAKGAFENGYEAYGYDILKRVAELVRRDDGKLYFLYEPHTRAPQGRGPSAWGAAAILSAIDQGLAGIVDTDKLYRTMRFSPRWAVTEHAEGRYLTGYEVSKRKIDVRWIFTDRGFRYRLECPSERVDAHLLVPAGKVPARLLFNGREIPFKSADVFGSRYVDATVVPQNGLADFEVLYR